ncbi:MAG: hypothetical protein LBL80_04260 [Ruminococcus sp.]|jgi:hypothetical protein|nr:hypothetical protein [Ruminococcus sp.]
MGFFSWVEPPDETASLTAEIADLKSSFMSLQSSLNNRSLSIEGYVSNIIKLYQIQNMDVANLRREILSYIIPNSEPSAESSEDIFMQTDLSYPKDEDIKEAFAFAKTPGSSAYYKEVIRPALDGLPFAVSFYVRLEDLFTASDSEHSAYKAFLRDRYIDYLIYDENRIICAVLLPHKDSVISETKKYLDFIERLLNIFNISLLYEPSLEELKTFLNEKREN